MPHTPSRTPFIGGNWKMNTDRASAAELAVAVGRGVPRDDKVDVVVFPPLVYLQHVRESLDRAGLSLRTGAQDCYHAEKGAFTGEVSPSMIKDCGATAVLCGHSERRHILHEGDDLVNLKVRSALHAGLTVVLCVGEKLEQRLTDQTDTVNERQVRLGLRDVKPDEMARMVIAYEPVWAIGTGKVATAENAQEAHAHIRSVVADMFGKDAAAALRIIYGGSATAQTVGPLLAQPDVDGGLVGGGSLKADDFLTVCRLAAEAKR